MSRNQKSLNVLAMLLKNLYIVLEEEHVEMKSTLHKFVIQIVNSSQQVSGSVNIMMPEGDIFNEEQALRNKQLMDKLEQIMESWTQKIAQTIKKEEAKKAEPNSSIAEIEYWRARNAVISTLYQYFIIYGFWDEKYTLYILILLRYILFLTN